MLKSPGKKLLMLLVRWWHVEATWKTLDAALTTCWSHLEDALDSALKTWSNLEDALDAALITFWSHVEDSLDATLITCSSTQKTPLILRWNLVESCRRRSWCYFETMLKSLGRCSWCCVDNILKKLGRRSRSCVDTWEHVEVTWKKLFILYWQHVEVTWKIECCQCDESTKKRAEQSGWHPMPWQSLGSHENWLLKQLNFKTKSEGPSVVNLHLTEKAFQWVWRRSKNVNQKFKRQQMCTEIRKICEWWPMSDKSDAAAHRPHGTAEPSCHVCFALGSFKGGPQLRYEWSERTVRSRTYLSSSMLV